MIGALGDIHGDFASARQILGRHPEITLWLCVGDIADDHGRYEPLPAPVFWVKGNNENFDAIAAGDLPPGLHYIRNGTSVDVNGIRVAGLGGTLAPTVYGLSPSDLPHPRKTTPKATALADRRRHFVQAEVEACQAMRDVDVLLTHEAASPFRAFPGGRGPDAGKRAINEVLAAMRPKLHLFGHHHRFSEQEREGVPSIGLDLVSRSYLLIEPGTMKYHVSSTTA